MSCAERFAVDVIYVVVLSCSLLLQPLQFDFVPLAVLIDVDSTMHHAKSVEVFRKTPDNLDTSSRYVADKETFVDQTLDL